MPQIIPIRDLKKTAESEKSLPAVFGRYKRNSENVK